MNVRRRAEIALATVAALLTIPAAYALLRLYDVAFHAQANPATTISSTTIAMFWRVEIGAFVAPVVGFAVFEAARRDVARTVEALYVGAYLVAALVAAQAIVVP